VTYTTKSGGFRTLYNNDAHRIDKTQNYKGQMATKVIEFKFDFIAPEHCSSIGSKNKCSNGEKPINVGNDITKVDVVFN
jgi:hypothetical protein